MQYRIGIALSLWGCAAALIAVALLTFWGDPCSHVTSYRLEAAGTGVLVAGATVTSLHARSGAAIAIAAVVGAAAGGLLFVIGEVHWVGSCTA